MKRCVFCGTENEDSATECVRCHNQLPDKPDGVEDRVVGFSGDPDIDTARQPDGVFSGVTAPGFEAEAAEKAGEAAQKASEAAPEAGEPAPDGNMPGEDTGASAEAGPAASETAPEAEETAPAEGAEAAQAGGAAPESAEYYAQDEAAPAEDGAAVAGEAAPEAGAPYTDYTSADFSGAAAESFARQPEGTAGGRISPRRADGAPGDFEVGRGQTYGARQMYEARGGRRDTPAREQYGSAGYGYRQAPSEGANSQGRTDLSRVSSSQVGSKTILFRSRKMVKGFLFFLMALSFTAMIVMNFWNCVLPGTMDPSISNAQYNLNNASAYLTSILGDTNGFALQLVSELTMHVVQLVTNVTGIVRQLGTSVQLGFLLVLAVPNVLYALALWIMFFQTKRSRTKFGMGGYTLARVMMVLKFIVGCLVLAIGLIISVYFVVVGASSAKFTSSFIQGLIMLIVMIVVAIFTIMYYVQWIFTLKCAKVNVKAGLDIGRAPVYIGVISILMALGQATAVLPLAPNDYVGIGAGASTALFFLVSGIWVLVYHAYVKRPLAKRS